MSYTSSTRYASTSSTSTSATSTSTSSPGLIPPSSRYLHPSQPSSSFLASSFRNIGSTFSYPFRRNRPLSLTEDVDPDEKVKKRSRQRPRGRRWGFVVLISIFLISLYVFRKMHRSEGTYELDGWRRDDGGLGMTHFLSHSPGYSAIQNL